MINAEIVKSFFDAQSWVFAKTMGAIPHEYVIKPKCKDAHLFDLVVNFIRDNGSPEYFFKTRYLYFYHGNYKYWIMNGYHRYFLINRCLI